MPWPTLTRRARREQVRDDIASHLPGADASVPNSVLRVVGDAQASLTHDNDQHLDWVARMMMPDTAEGEFCDRWGGIWLPHGRKGASYAAGQITVSGSIGAQVSTGTRLTAPAYTTDGTLVGLEFEVTQGVTLAATSAVVPVTALTPGALANLDEGAQMSFVVPLGGVDGSAVVATPGLAGGAEIESDPEYRERYIARIQEPPHGGARHDYPEWAKEVPGVTRAWARREMGIGTMTVRFMMDHVRAAEGGLPKAEDLALVYAHIDGVRPTTVADLFVEAPIPQMETIGIANLNRDTPEVRHNIQLEVQEMLRARAAPGQVIYASWVREAVSAATGEDHHDLVVDNLIPASLGHMIFIAVEFED